MIKGTFNDSMSDFFANRIVDCKAIRSAKTDFILDAVSKHIMPFVQPIKAG